jgi:hypothetical protein
MKNFLLSFMILVMFTPGLSCAQFMDHHPDSMTKNSMSKNMPCCPKSKNSSGMDVPLFKDCMKIDLQQAHGPQFLKKVDVEKKTFPFIQTQALKKEFSPLQNRGARDPPFAWRTSLSETYPPVFLATQRLRI